MNDTKAKLKPEDLERLFPGFSGFPRVFVVVAGADQALMGFPFKLLPYFVHEMDLRLILGSPSLVKAARNHGLSPVVESASRLKMFWMGDVVDSAHKIRDGVIKLPLRDEVDPGDSAQRKS